MKEEEISDRIKELKAKRNFILESRRNPVLDSSSLEGVGYAWSLRLDPRYEYRLEVFSDIKETAGADSACIEHSRGLWLRLYYHQNTTTRRHEEHTDSL